MAETMNIEVPARQTATLIRKGKPLLQWPAGSLVSHTLEEGDTIVLSDNTPVKPMEPIDVLRARLRREQQALDASNAELVGVLDEVLDLLVAGNIVRKAQFSGKASEAFDRRKAARNRIAQLQAEIQALVNKP
ncbi:MAG: hypothetical protein BWX88_05197 [Planctomycetes bacterium ADurb.Bin126]|nr:MAG: hypothetical protein BWX88_05197 [Planctomycetes bacterium ADurb.Bin126]HOD84876.1 hypothetical protein [Phycisphaerae bacterium]HQL76056.1 hypothetical protein [Phycisphaerae bacterium]